jgi:hypothetical protein
MAASAAGTVDADLSPILWESSASETEKSAVKTVCFSAGEPNGSSQKEVLLPSIGLLGFLTGGRTRLAGAASKGFGVDGASGGVSSPVYRPWTDAESQIIGSAPPLGLGCSTTFGRATLSRMAAVFVGATGCGTIRCGIAKSGTVAGVAAACCTGLGSAVAGTTAVTLTGGATGTEGRLEEVSGSEVLVLSQESCPGGAGGVVVLAGFPTAGGGEVTQVRVSAS